MQRCRVLLVVTCYIFHFLATTRASPTQLAFTPPNRSIERKKSPLKMKNTDERDKPKKLVLIRHGCTYMNEYLSKPGSRWGDANFTDVFQDDSLGRYRDSPLSKDGIEQAEGLMELLSSCPERKALVEDIDIVVSSPLTRALQTTELALLPHLKRQEGSPETRHVPIVALPLATERLYLISDHGSSTEHLSKRFPFVDFESEHKEADEWWFQVLPDEIFEKQSNHRGPFRSMRVSDYVEWRPNEDGQVYACHGEPDFHFHSRMIALSDWLSDRNESTICLVAHWGVLEWLTGGDDFNNCEMKVIDLCQLRRR